MNLIVDVLYGVSTRGSALNKPLAQHDPGGPADSAAASVSDALGRTAEPTAPPVRRGEILRRPSGVPAAALVLLVCPIALFPQWFAGWFGHGDPRACNLIEFVQQVADLGAPVRLRSAGLRPLRQRVYGTRASLAIALIVTFELRWWLRCCSARSPATTAAGPTP